METIKYNAIRADDILKIASSISHWCTQLSVAIIDLTTHTPEMFGVNIDQFMYPASCYKIFIGAEVLRQIETGKLSLYQKIKVESPNDVDTDPLLFSGDPRSLLLAGDTVTIEYLLDLMLTRSDNTASNCLIDLVGRESINTNIIDRYGWQGSEVTRKFLDRTKEDEPYRSAKSTMSCTRHLAEFFFLVENSKLISRFVSEKLQYYMFRTRGGRAGLNLKEYDSFYRKGGWFENNLWKQDHALAAKNLEEKGWAVIRWDNDAGVVWKNSIHYVVAMMSLTKMRSDNDYFDTEALAKKILAYMKK